MYEQYYTWITKHISFQTKILQQYPRRSKKYRTSQQVRSLEFCRRCISLQLPAGELQEEYRGDFFFYRVTFIIGPRCDRVSLAFQWARPAAAAPSAGPQKLLFIKCCDASTHMQSVRKKRSLPPEERTAFWRSQWWWWGEKKKYSQRFVALSYEFFYLVRYFWHSWQIVLRQF